MRRILIPALCGCLCAGIPLTQAHACTEPGEIDVPASIAAAMAVVADNPDDTEARFALARACAQAGRYNGAIEHYDSLLARDAGNADWLLGEAQVLVWQQRPRDALPLLERARAVAPTYEDVWLLYASALELMDEYARADALLAEAERAFPQSAWPAERRRTLRELQLLRWGTRMSLSASHDELTDDRPAWRALTLNFDKPLDERRRLLGGINVEERFDQRDEQVAIGYVQRLSGAWSWGLAGEFARDAQILPEWSIAAEAGRVLSGNRSAGLRVRHASYESVDVDSLSATLEQYAGSIRAAFTLTASRPSGVNAELGYSLRIAHDYGTVSNVALAVGYGDEAETVAPGVVRVTRNTYVALYGVHWRNAGWGVSWEAGWYEQGDLYRRVRLRLGLEHRF